MACGSMREAQFAAAGKSKVRLSMTRFRIVMVRAEECGVPLLFENVQIANESWKS